LAELKPIAERHDTSTGNIVLNWTIQQPGVTVALVGARDGAQATENAKAADLKLSAEEIATINKLLEQLDKVQA
ncbi:MAG TPA: aldo/keto reductase, partial [Drouetiella sp.]